MPRERHSDRTLKTALLILRQLRPHQWVKNLLVFAPLFFSESWTLPLAQRSLAAFVVFSLLASAGYCLNDLLDYEKDKNHPVKRSRPIASGALPRRVAWLCATLLALTAMLIAFAFSRSLFGVAGIYLVLQLSYSLLLKNIAILDLLVLSTFYVLRVLAGAVVTGILPSTWIITFTWLISLMLATGKRYSEVAHRGTRAQLSRPVLLRYSPQHLRQFVTAFGALSIMCYILWCQEAIGRWRFSTFEILPSVLIVSYGILRYTLLVLQKRFDDDPTRGLLGDPPIIASVVVFLLYLGAVIYEF
ncbi:MAG: UbiA prenyltransferase family protein [Deltaproteobacteria bacterium]|nr:UbiA prenyltransferase family protein [Deltaproteobacteria bacterium]